jgi:hypothetical protein
MLIPLLVAFLAKSIFAAFSIPTSVTGICSFTTGNYVIVTSPGFLTIGGFTPNCSNFFATIGASVYTLEGVALTEFSATPQISSMISICSLLSQLPGTTQVFITFSSSLGQASCFIASSTSIVSTTISGCSSTIGLLCQLPLVFSTGITIFSTDPTTTTTFSTTFTTSTTIVATTTVTGTTNVDTTFVITTSTSTMDITTETESTTTLVTTISTSVTRTRVETVTLTLTDYTTSGTDTFSTTITSTFVTTFLTVSTITTSTLSLTICTQQVTSTL